MYHNTDLFDIPFNHETDDDSGWYYQDKPYGGFLVYDLTEVQTTRDDQEVRVPLAVTVEFTDLEDACGEPGYLVAGNLTPLPSVLSRENLENVSWQRDDDGNPVADLMDVAQYGLCVPLDNSWGAESWEAGFEELRDTLTLQSILPGFYLDRPWNRLGTTGWELLDDALFDEDAFQKTAERRLEEMA
jgi:hypothetical protein